MLTALMRVAGAALRRVDLGGCCRIGSQEMEEILRAIHVSCGSVESIDVTGCSNQACLRAVAVCAEVSFGVASPRELLERLQALQEGQTCFTHLRTQLLEGPPPRLMLDPEFVPGEDMLFESAAHGKAWDMALLLGVAYSHRGQIRTFDCNQGKLREYRTLTDKELQADPFSQPQKRPRYPATRDPRDQREVEGSSSEKQQRTPIHFAAERCDEAMLDVLLSAHVNLDPADYSSGYSPLLSCIVAGNLSYAKKLLDAGANVEGVNMRWKRSAKGQRFSDNTPLMASVAEGHLSFAQILVDKGADVECKNERGQRPIHFAAELGDETMLAMLVHAGANVDPQDHGGNTPLLVSIEAGHLAFAHKLLDAGANIDGKHSSDSSCWVDRAGNTPLLAMIAAGHLGFAKKLVESGANVETARKVDGANLLSLAIVTRKEDVINFAFKYGPRRFDGQGTADAVHNVKQLAQSFLDPKKIGGWLHGGASMRGLSGEIGSLLSSTVLDRTLKSQLEDVRAFISHPNNDPMSTYYGVSQWLPSFHARSIDRRDLKLERVSHFVEQLASQEPDSMFRRVPTEAQRLVQHDKTPAVHAIIECVSKPHGRRACRLTMPGNYPVFFSDGSKLALGGDILKICDARTGFVESILTRNTMHRFSTLLFLH